MKKKENKKFKKWLSLPVFIKSIFFKSPLNQENNQNNETSEVRRHVSDMKEQVKQNLDDQPTLLKCYLKYLIDRKKNDKKNTTGAATHQGDSLYLTDRHTIIKKENGNVFCGLFSGFNGHQTAEYLAKHLGQSLLHYTKLTNSIFRDDIVAEITNIFKTHDKKILSQLATRKSGSTAAIILVKNKYIICAHLGNCGILHVENNGNIQLTMSHTTARVNEHVRIKKTKGNITKIKSNNIDGKPKYLLGNELYITRAFGYSKLYTIQNDKPQRLKLVGLNCEPHIQVLDKKNIDFIVLGTPELFKNLSSTLITAEVKKGLILKKTPQRIAKKLVNLAYKQYGDCSSNISAMLTQV